MNLTCFKAYDIRGQLITQLDEDIAFRIGLGFARCLNAKSVVVGGDVRLTSRPLLLSLSAGLIYGGCKVYDLGLAGTEEVYFATQYLKVDGGIEVTASHNPIDYNGMKLVREGSQPISGDTGLSQIQQVAQSISDEEVAQAFSLFKSSSSSSEAFLNGHSRISEDALIDTNMFSKTNAFSAYIEHLISYVDLTKFKPLKIVVNAGNGAAGHVVNALEQAFSQLNIAITLIKVHNEPDGTFPHGIPNPLLPEARQDTSDAVIRHQADLGIAWDGDFDRCFLFDEQGRFIEGYYIVGLLAEAFLQKHSGAKVIYDPRVYWNTQDMVQASGGVGIMSKTGHAFIKERMRKEDAVYGGEMSAHHYFKDFAYCDSGMIPWLLVAELMSIRGQSLSSMVSSRMKLFPSSGEINRKLENPDLVIEKIKHTYEKDALTVIDIDGLSYEFADWRFNVRKSNTEPLLRLNVESRGDQQLMENKTQALLDLLI
jgi:phosphomannomutase